MRRMWFLWPALTAALLLATSETTRADESHGKGAKATTTRAKVERVNASDGKLVVRTREGKEVTLFADPETTFLSNNRKVRLKDLHEGMDLTVVYYKEGQRYVVNAITLPDKKESSSGARGTTAEPPQGQDHKEAHRKSDDKPEQRSRSSERRAEGREAELAGAHSGSGAGDIRGRITQVRSDPKQLILRTAEGKEVVLDLDDQQPVQVRYEAKDGKRVLRSLAATGSEAASVSRPAGESPAAPASAGSASRPAAESPAAPASSETPLPTAGFPAPASGSIPPAATPLPAGPPPGTVPPQVQPGTPGPTGPAGPPSAPPRRRLFPRIR